MQLGNLIKDDNDNFWVVAGNIWLTDILAAMLLMLIFFLVFSLLFDHWTSIQNLKNEKAITELALLKTQINPHFFFNTLNNLYSLIKKDPDIAQEYVLKLSDMMRFTIYGGQEESVTLDDEIQYLRNFIELQTGRYHSTIQINFEHHITNHSRSIPPLLFIILVENAFKHGVEKLLSGAFINIEITEDDGRVVFKIENNFDAESSAKQQGIGLENLRERLDLLYPNQYQLQTSSANNIYTARLELNKAV